MKLSQLVASLDGVSALRESDPTVLSVTDDSRNAGPGSLFVARGAAAGDRSRFIADAIAKGAVAIGVGEEVAIQEWAGQVPAILKLNEPARQAVELAHAFHGYPARSMRMVGITGTNGKTTTAFLLQHLLAQSGSPCGLLGTVFTDDGKSRTPSSLTTPGGCELAQLLGRMVSNGCVAAAMEVSSHALDQGRVAGIDFSAAIFTNLTGDHLDYHGTLEEYASVKAMLFSSLHTGACAIVNMDDPAHLRMMDECRASHLKCSCVDDRADCFAQILRVSLASMELRVKGPWGSFDVTMRCVGEHNAMNALQAAACAWTLGVSASQLAIGLASANAPPGRLEPVSGGDDPFAVLVDYAHTDDALLNVLKCVRKVAPDGRIVLVFGCGGDRDRTKRPRMARTAVEWADHVIVTSDNPRTESPDAILDEIMAGIPESSTAIVERQVDRASAIARAVSVAGPGDLVLIAGKGHEDYQIVGTQKRHFDDREVARAALRSRCGVNA